MEREKFLENTQKAFDAISHLCLSRDAQEILINLMMLSGNGSKNTLYLGISLPSSAMGEIKLLEKDIKEALGKINPNYLLYITEGIEFYQSIAWFDEKFNYSSAIVAVLRAVGGQRPFASYFIWPF